MDGLSHFHNHNNTSCFDTTGCVPGCYRSHSYEAQWEWSYWVESAQAQTEQRERWLHMVAEARKYQAKDKHALVLASCGTSFELNLDLFG